MLYLTSIEAFSHSASCIHPSARITPVRRHVIVIWRDFIFEKEKKRRNGTRRWTKKTPNSFFSFSSRDDEGDRVGNVGHLERQSRPPGDRQQQDTRRVKHKHNDIHAQPPRPKTYGPIQFPTIGNKTDKKGAPGVCVTLFPLSSQTCCWRGWAVVVVVVELSVGLCPTIISFVFLPEFRRLCWPGRRPQPRLV